MTTPEPQRGGFTPWGSAHISDDGLYRWELSRRWAPGLVLPDSGKMWLAIVMLNPSTADAMLDDPTIRRCRSFAQREGYTAMAVYNLYGLRATDPKDLWTVSDPVGEHNDAKLRAILHAQTDLPGAEVLVAWGANARPSRVERFLQIATEVDALDRLRCLGTTKSGAPKHPLYVKGDQPFLPWPSAESFR